MKHLEGKPVSKGTYDYHRCRCEGCREANRQWMRAHRLRNGQGRKSLPYDRARNLANYRAAAEFRRRFPRLWRQMLEQAQREVAATLDEVAS